MLFLYEWWDNLNNFWINTARGVFEIKIQHKKFQQLFADKRITNFKRSTRGIFAGGFDASTSNVIQYVTIATTGNALDFGDLTVRRYYAGACSNSTRGVFGGGVNSSFVNINVIDYITIASTGNATDFGDMLADISAAAGCSSSTRGVFGGGNTGSSTNVIQYVTIGTTGNSTDFGDLLTATTRAASCSNSHGGL